MRKQETQASTIIRLRTPLQGKDIEALRAGQKVLLSGVIYTARDAAHQRLIELLEQGAPSVFDLQGQVIYYVGPCPAKPGKVIGPCGPTTSYRMDKYSPLLLERGLKGMIGKGPRSQEVIEAMKQFKAVYFAAIGGAAALIAECVKRVEIIAFEDLGTEAIRRLVVEDFPLFVINDIYGNDLYEEGVRRCKV